MTMLQEATAAVAPIPIEDASTMPALPDATAGAVDAERAALVHGVGSDGLRVDLGDDEFAIVSGPDVGVYKIFYVQDDEGVTRPRTATIAPYVLWIRRVVRPLTIDAFGRTVEAAPPSHDVELIRRDGRRFLKTDLSAEALTKIQTLIASLGASVKVPIEAKDRLRLANSLLVLGAEVREEVIQYTSCGWARIDGEWTLLAPAGSMTPTGIRKDLIVGPPAGSAAEALTPAERGIGWAHLPDAAELRRAAPVIRAMGDVVVPHRRGVVYAMLGQVFSAPLPLNRRATTWIVSPPSSGKTTLASALMQLTCTAPFTGSEYNVDLASGTTKVGATAALAWARNIAVFADDYKMTEDQAANARITGAAHAIALGSYGSTSGKKGNAHGGVAATVMIDTASIVTGEVQPPGGSTGSRVLTMALDRGDIRLAVEGETAKESHFHRSLVEPYLDTGLANALMAAYVHWLAVRLQRDGLDELRRATVHAAGSSFPELTGRTQELMSSLRAGWCFFLEWAREAGIADLIPSQAEVDAELLSLAPEVAETIDEGAAGPRRIEAIRDLLASRQVHLVDQGGQEPADPGACGWTQTKRYDHTGAEAGLQWSPSRNEIGIISDDQRWVVITPGGLSNAEKVAGLPPLGKVARNQALAPHLAEGADTKPVYPKGRGFKNPSIRGWVFPAAAFGIGLPDAEQEVEVDDEPF